LAAYPLDTIRRRMMMTSGEKVDHFAHMLRTDLLIGVGTI
jgi:hypothetical protein